MCQGGSGSGWVRGRVRVGQGQGQGGAGAGAGLVRVRVGQGGAAAGWGRVGAANIAAPTDCCVKALRMTHPLLQTTTQRSGTLSETHPV